MGDDIHNWDSLTPRQIYQLLKDLQARWLIAGGWAIDLFLGECTRDHGDIDILILRKEQLIVQKYLAGWDLYKTNQPGLQPWSDGEYLEQNVNDIWCRRNTESPWAFQIMLMETDDDMWVYRRRPSIREPIASLVAITEEGLPYLRPEIQLLYKAKCDTFEKDQHDFDLVIPRLSDLSRKWLLDCLSVQFIAGHPWIDRLKAI